MKRQRVETEGVSLFVTSEGSGPPVVLLHGFTGSGRTLARTARDLRPGFHTVRVDLVGHGRSDAPPEPAAYTLEACAAQVAGVVAATCREPAHLVGYSMGGRVALALAAWHPDRVRSAILIGARAGILRAADRAERRRRDEALATEIERDGLAAFVARWMALPLFASQARLGPEYLLRARRERMRQRPNGLAASLRGMGAGAQPPLFDRLAEIRIPMLLVVGASDARFADIARDLAERLPDAQLARIPAAGHAAHVEQPETFARRARDFLNVVEARREIASSGPHGPDRIGSGRERQEDPCRV